MTNKIFISLMVLLVICVSTSNCSKDSDNIIEPTCSDGIQNGNEDGVDCGGDCSDCISCFDGIQNGNETGIDCGGDCEEDCLTTITDCSGEEDCMQAFVGGIFWEALGFEALIDNNELQVSGVNLSPGVNTSINLFFPDVLNADLPLTITINDTNSFLVKIVKLVGGELRTYEGTDGEFTLLTFDEENKSASGIFNVTGTTITALGSIVTITAAEGKFNVNW